MPDVDTAVKEPRTSWEVTRDDLETLANRAEDFESHLKGVREQLIGSGMGEEELGGEEGGPIGGAKMPSNFHSRFRNSIASLNETFERLETLLGQIRA